MWPEDWKYLSIMNWNFNIIAIQFKIIFFVQNLEQKNNSRCETLACFFLFLMGSFMGFLFKDLWKMIRDSRYIRLFVRGWCLEIWRSGLVTTSYTTLGQLAALPTVVGHSHHSLEDCLSCPGSVVTTSQPFTAYWLPMCFHRLHPSLSSD